MIVHVDVEVVEAGEDSVALDAIDGPKVVLDLVLVLAHGGIAAPGLGLGRAEGGLGGHGRLGQVVQGEFVTLVGVTSVAPGLGFGT